MTNFNVEDFIKNLSPELQEQARMCKSAKEVLELAADNDIELPDEALEMVAGGGCNGPSGTPYCKIHNVACKTVTTGAYGDRIAYECPFCKPIYNQKEVDFR